MKKKSKKGDPKSFLNKKAGHNYILSDFLEAGIALEGWEVKSIRAGKIQISDSYVRILNGIPVAINIVVTPLESASTHKVCQPSRTRKLLLHKKEINKLIGFTQVKHQTLIPTKVYFKKDLVKLQFALAKGKKQYDKRQCEKEKTWKLEQSRIAKYSNKC